MKLPDSQKTPNSLLSFQNQLTSILASLKTVLERKALNKEDAQLIATAYKNAHDLITVTKDFISKNNLKEEGNNLLEFLKKEMEVIINEVPVKEENSLAPIYQNIIVSDKIKSFWESQAAIELTDSDQNWLFQIEQKIETEISNFDFNAEKLAGQIFISRRQLDRKLKLLTGLTTGQFIREIKMQQAHKLIIENNINSIKTIAYKVGIKSVSHFSKQYKSRFKISPSQSLKDNK